MSDFSDSDSEISKSDKIFNSATQHVQNIHANLHPSDLLDLYALYKQGTTGRCHTAKPGIFNVQGRAKWNAWNDLGNMTKADAKRLYVEKLSAVDLKWRTNCGEKAKSQTNWVVHSVPMIPDDVEGSQCPTEHEKTIFDYVKERNFERVKEILYDMQSINILDQSGMGLIHWATDRNASNILEYLLLSGANVNLQDSEGQTALHYAASCGHFDCIRILIKFGADKETVDGDGQTCLAVADDENIRKLLES